MYRIREEQHVAADDFLGHVEHGQPLIDVHVTAQAEVVQDKEDVHITTLHIGEGMHFHLGPLSVFTLVQMLMAVADPDAMANAVIEEYADSAPLAPAAAETFRNALRQQVEAARAWCAADNDEWEIK